MHVKRERGGGEVYVGRGRGGGEVERVLKKRGNRTHKKHRLQNAKSAAALRLRVLASARECARVHGYARVVRFFSLFFFSPPSRFFLSRSAFAFSPFNDTHTRVHMHAPALPRSFYTLVLLYLRVRCTTDAEKARIKLSRWWFAVCIAWRCRVMRAGVRIHGRRRSRNADRWNDEGTRSFFREIRARQKVRRHPPLRGMRVAFRMASQDSSIPRKTGTRFFVLCESIPPSLHRSRKRFSRFARIRSDIGTQ